jgi:hypothetical protein
MFTRNSKFVSCDAKFGRAARPCRQGLESTCFLGDNFNPEGKFQPERAVAKLSLARTFKKSGWPEEFVKKSLKV